MPTMLAAGYVWLRYQVLVPAEATESTSHGDQPEGSAARGPGPYAQTMP
ncbi:hypothetical protein ACYJW8_04720 [Frateuria aurantia]